MGVMTHTSAIYRHLRAGRTLTTAQAAKRWDCYRLAARIKDLRDQGIPIETTMAEKYGRRYAVYSINKRALASQNASR